MPAVVRVKSAASGARVAKGRKPLGGEAIFPVSEVQQDCSDCDVPYPTDESQRSAFVTPEGKKVTPHQWAVYDFTRTIPCGRITTYKDLCVALGQGSPRSVGSALRNNPFAPYVPCHRIIASNLYIGGFYGEWGTGKDEKLRKGTGVQCHRKMEMLAKEGVAFSKDGYLIDKSLIWRGDLP
ncbi:DNA binding methylated-DNA--cysteine S-methyltransferase [Leucogyrophana mollusca]|uniref:DNA binding methylated-DNA--cysteine S-methyltransferase n=1 Tax=Leucogyrophana mollusca TaxID=85980 RepID=A0ACB8BB20_9AGAM|nr:DNA binding methylated-DNA--cysteine S-methyltransferase [Leucogyrophana mollusca]